MNDGREDVKKNSVEPLLPNYLTIKRTPPARGHDFRFKCYIVISMTLLWTGYAVTTRYIRYVNLGKQV